jgi:hypothetical protein
MEMSQGRTDGTGQRFWVRSMANTPRQREYGEWLSMFVHPALNSVAMLLSDIGDKDRFDRLLDIRRRFEP